jgi:AraC-like DNA-binding protein
MNISGYTDVDRIMFSCEFDRKRETQQFIPVHVFGCIISGSLKVYGNGETQTFNEGDIAIFKANQLGKFIKHPPDNGTGFKSINVLFDEAILQSFSREYDVKAAGAYTGQTLRLLKRDRMLHDYFNALLPYFDSANKLSTSLTTLKVKEAIMLLLQSNSDLKDMLFDFKQPGKIDLEEFMEKNFKFNVPMSRFAQLTGRSLASFKRDFNTIFKKPPGKWLQHRRLEEARYLIGEKGKKSSDIYMDVGFQDLSHFSFAFKKAYGVAPSMIG